MECTQPTSLPRQRHVNFRIKYFAALVAVVALASGCGGSGSSTPSGGSGGNLTVSGNTATTTDHAVSITVPSNAPITASQLTVAPLASSGLPVTTGLVGGGAYSIGPSGTQFVAGSPLSITLSYNPATLPVGAVQANLAIYTVVNGVWTALPSTVDTVNHTITGQTTHLSPFAIIAKNGFSGDFTGHYTGEAAGSFEMTVDSVGNVVVNGTDSSAGVFTGTGTTTLSGNAAVSAATAGSGTLNNGGTFTFNGTFTHLNGAVVVTNGTWTSHLTGGPSFNGTWTIP